MKSNVLQPRVWPVQSGTALTWNEMKYIPFNKIYIKLEQFQVKPENKTQGNLEAT